MKQMNREWYLDQATLEFDCEEDITVSLDACSQWCWFYLLAYEAWDDFLENTGA